MYTMQLIWDKINGIDWKKTCQWVSMDPLKKGKNDGCHQETCKNWCSKDVQHHTSNLMSNWASS